MTLWYVSSIKHWTDIVICVSKCCSLFAIRYNNINRLRICVAFYPEKLSWKTMIYNIFKQIRVANHKIKNWTKFYFRILCDRTFTHQRNHISLFYIKWISSFCLLISLYMLVSYVFHRSYNIPHNFHIVTIHNQEIQRKLFRRLIAKF